MPPIRVEAELVRELPEMGASPSLGRHDLNLSYANLDPREAGYSGENQLWVVVPVM